jgi:hypothetical protein
MPPNRTPDFVRSRYGSDECRRAMAERLAFRHNIGRTGGEIMPASTQKAEEVLDRLDTAQLTLLELEMQGSRPGHESDYDPFARG